MQFIQAWQPSRWMVFRARWTRATQLTHYVPVLFNDAVPPPFSEFKTWEVLRFDVFAFAVAVDGNPVI
jgi:hypothetical protein